MWLRQVSGGQLARAGHALLRLQRRYGNRHVQQVVSYARQAADPVIAPVVQAKLVLGSANALDEQQADRVARQAVGQRASDGSAARQQGSEEREARLLRQADVQPPRGAAAGGGADAGVQRALQRLGGGGQPLPAPLRGRMEQALGADFGGVRAHTGAQSDQLNRSLQATAFTSGQDIFFRWCVPGFPEVSCWILVPLESGGGWHGTARLSAGVPPQGAGPGRSRQADRRGRPGLGDQALGISDQSSSTWRRQDRIDRGLEPGLTSAERSELVAAKRRIAELETELRATRRAIELVRAVVPPTGASRRSG